MEYEHQVERELMAELRRSVDQYREGDPLAREHFIEAARAFLRLLVSHIQKEDNILFRIGDEMLDDAEKTVLTERFKQVEMELSERTVEDFERAAAALESRWAI
jgi:hemerythrin-like domain-containing protein